MAEAPGTLEGWFALHDFRALDWRGLDALGAEARGIATGSATALLEDLLTVTDSDEGASAAYRIVGHKADLLLLHLRPSLEALSRIETRTADSGLGHVSSRVYSYVSAVELSLYEAKARAGTDDEAALMAQPFVRKRLFPAIPEDKPYISFYPMNKRRGEAVNWYMADMEERRAMMREHATTGRKFTDEIQQMITGSMGLDDWEWGVTLFGSNPVAIKKLVAAMRFDEVSARYAEFGPFYAGFRIGAADIARLIEGITD